MIYVIFSVLAFLTISAILIYFVSFYKKNDKKDDDNTHKPEEETKEPDEDKKPEDEKKPDEKTKEPDKKPDEETKEPDKKPDEETKEPDKKPDEETKEPDKKPDEETKEPDDEKKPDEPEEEISELVISKLVDALPKPDRSIQLNLRNNDNMLYVYPAVNTVSTSDRVNLGNWLNESIQFQLVTIPVRKLKIIADKHLNNKKLQINYNNLKYILLNQRDAKPKYTTDPLGYRLYDNWYTYDVPGNNMSPKLGVIDIKFGNNDSQITIQFIGLNVNSGKTETKSRVLQKYQFVQAKKPMEMNTVTVQLNKNVPPEPFVLKQVKTSLQMDFYVELISDQTLVTYTFLQDITLHVDIYIKSTPEVSKLKEELNKDKNPISLGYHH